MSAVLALSYFAGAALSSSPPSRAASPQSGKINTETKNGVIIFSDWQFPDTLNLFQTGLGVTSYVMNAVYEGLDLTDNHAKLQPDLLSSLPSIKNHEILDHGHTIILRLRHGIYRSSGVEITNQDILFGWKMYSDPITGPACLESCDGYAHGFTLDFLTTSGNPTRDAEFGVLEKNWASLGVTLNFDAKPPSTFAGDWNHQGPRNLGALQVNLWTFGSSPDPDAFRNYFVSKFIDRATDKHSAVNSNYAGIDDPVIDNAMRRGASSFDQKVRARWYRMMQERLNKQAYRVILYYRANAVTSDKHVVGDTLYPTSGVFGNTWNLWAWSFKGG